VPSAIEVRSLSRVFSGRKEIVALDDVDLTVEEGELFGLLGPNGAGKTTLIKILCTLLLPSSGTARVLGYDVDSEAKQIRKRINMVSGGEISGYGLLTIRENLWMFTQFYGVQGKVAKQRIDALLEEFGLGVGNGADDRDDAVGFAAACVKVLGDASYAVELGRNARERARHYSYPRLAQDVQRLVSELREVSPCLPVNPL